MQKVLIIDDEKPTLGMFQLFLKAYGYAVYTAENGEQGLELFEREKPPLVITDIKMPGMDGIEVLRRIKDMNPDTEVIIITGHGDTDLTVQAMKLNATDFLHKPIDKKALEQALKRAKERISLMQSQEEQISLSFDNGLAIIDLQGNINASHEDTLRDVYTRILDKGATRILFRFKSNSSVNGTGIALLIQILSQSQEYKQKTAMTGLSDNFQKFFNLLGITKMVRIFPNEEEAATYLAA